MATEGKESKQPQADWSTAMTRRLITVLLDEVALGKRADTGFKACSYERALKEVNAELDSSGKNPGLSLKQIKNKVTNVSLSLLKHLLSANTRAVEKRF
jgi:hypothetical protein